MHFRRDSDKGELWRVEPRLCIMLLAADGWAQRAIDKELVITSLIRTEAENAAVGATSRTHVEGRAADIGTDHLDSDEIVLLLAFLHTNFYCRVQSITVYGDSRHQDHIHLQVCIGLTDGWRGFDV